MSIYVRDADGNRQKIAGVGLPGPAGKSAYQYAVEGGFSGTEEEFRAVVGVRSNPSLLDNWYFADPINQRGQEEYIGAGYTIDRWISSSGNNEVQIGADGVNLAIQINGAYFAQRIRPGVLNAGDVCTFSVLTTEGLFFGTETLIADGNYHGSILIGDNFYSQYIFENGSYQFAVIKNFSNTPASITLIAAKLELGPVQTLAHKEGDTWMLNDPPPNKALELAKCQYFQYTPFTNFTGYGDVATGYIGNETAAHFVISCPKMRSTPTLIIDNVAKFRITAKTKTGVRNDIIPESIRIQNSIGNCIMLWFTVDSSYGMEPGAACGLWVDQAPGTVPFLFDANL